MAAGPETARGRAEQAALAATAVFLVAAPFASSVGLRVLCLLVAALAIIASGAWRPAIHGQLPRAVLALFAAWLGLAALSLAWSVDPARTLGELRAESAYAALSFGVFFVLARDRREWRAWWIAIMAGTALTLAAKGLQDGLGIRLTRHSPDGGVGAFSTHLVLVAPLLFALVCAAPWGLRRSPRWLGVGLALLIFAAWTTRGAWDTPNRIVWPALAAVFVVAAVAARRAAGFDLAHHAGLRRMLAVGGAVLAIAFAAAIAAKSERLYGHEPGFAASVEHDLRPRLWSVAGDAWTQAPWLGHGLGREILSHVFVRETPTRGAHPPVTHAHNTLINIALQFGVVGLALFVALLAALARSYVAMLPDAATSALGVMGLALLAGFLTKNFTDDFFHRHNAQVFWALNGMFLGFARAARARRG